MQAYPRITIITPSYNQGKYIRATVESILSQKYPNLEYIVMDGGSSDDTLSILQEYPQIKVVSEHDRGQWDAINKGFNLATGEIWGYVNSDDTLLPGSLEWVAQEIDPALGHYIVLGRCQFTDQDGNYLEYEHPSGFINQIRILEIWKGHTIPQPAVFWTPEVWHTCGGMNGNLKSAWLDYDLFCRFSQRYNFHFIDQLFATYRIHIESKTSAKTEEERLEESIQISRQYWGPAWSPKHIHLSFSLAWHRLDLPARARKFHKRAQTARSSGRKLIALIFDIAAVILAPQAAFFTALYPDLKRRARGPFHKFLNRLVAPHPSLPQTKAHLNRPSVWNDGWAGPRLVVNILAEGGETILQVEGWFDLTFINLPLTLTAVIDGKQLGNQTIAKNGKNTLSYSIQFPISNGIHQVELMSAAWFISDSYMHNRDYRPLSWKPELQNGIRLKV